MDAFASAKSLSDRHSPGAVQEVLARFISDGHLLRHLRRMRELYQERQGVMIDSLRKASGCALQLAPAAQGMHIAHEIARGDDAHLSRRAGEAGVYLAPLSLYCVQAKRRGWLFGYAGFDDTALRLAARNIAPLIR